MKKESSIFSLSGSSKALLKASIFSNLAFGLLAPIYAIFAGGIGGNLLDIGIAYALYCVFSGIFIITFGTSRFFSNNVRRMVVLGYSLQTLGYFGYIFVRSPMPLFLSQIVLGVSNGILEPSWDSVYAAKTS
ncbi:MAG: hypothetical protein PHH00_04400, partial [Candidatus Nanoarchaeia archaeon]|nr:hypothetical protein [Candidatus Nanoarchaeia archaeon]